jgi:hypothetical protein
MLTNLTRPTRRTRIGVAAAMVAGSVLTASSCARHRTELGERAASAAADTNVKGIVSITGTSFDQHVQLRTDSGVLSLIAQSNDSAALARLGGLELSVRGTREPSGFRVSSFTVLRAGDRAVTDGVLVQDGASIALQTSAGKLTLGNPPDALRRMIGARVWVAGPLDAGPNSYGVIVPRP